MDIVEKLKLIKSEVLGSQEILKNVYGTYGSQTIADYVASWPIPVSRVNNGLAQSFFAAIKKLAAPLYGRHVTEEIVKQLQVLPLVSTVDHHGILNHPFFISSNLVVSQYPGIQYVVCLSTAGVSLNNSSWPGCLVMSHKEGGLKRLSFFTDSQKTNTVFSTPSLRMTDFQRVSKFVAEDGEIFAQHVSRLQILLAELSSQEVLGMSDFSSQASVMSSMLWQSTFPNAPRLAYIPIEDVVAQMLQASVVADVNSVLYSLLFTLDGWKLVEKYFQGTQGAFSADHKGSFLLWGVNSKGRRVHLHREGSFLKGEGYRLEFTPEAFSNALERKSAYPTTLLCFLTLLVSGVTCVGGFNQINWLTHIAAQFLLLLEELGEGRLRRQISQVPTQNFAEMNLAFLCNDKKQLHKATGIDIYLQNSSSMFKAYKRLAGQLTVGESIESLLPEMYQVMVPASKRKANLIDITDEMILEHNGAAEKIRNACSS